MTPYTYFFYQPNQLGQLENRDQSEAAICSDMGAAAGWVRMVQGYGCSHIADVALW